MQYLEDKVSRINGELYYNRVHEQIHLATKFTSRVPLEGWIFGAQRAKTSSPPPRNSKGKSQRSELSKGKSQRSELSKGKSQRSELKWFWKYLMTPNFCAQFQPNLLTTNFGPWNTFSDSDT